MMRFREWIALREAYEEALGTTNNVEAAFDIAEKHLGSMEALGIVDEEEFSTGKFTSMILPENEDGKRQIFDMYKQVAADLTKSSTKFRVLWKPIPAGSKIYQTIVIVHY